MLRDKSIVIIGALFVGIASGVYTEPLKKKRLGRRYMRALRNKNKNDVVDKEDVAFWTRLMQEGNVGSLPGESSPPAVTVSHDPSVIPFRRHVCIVHRTPIYRSSLTTAHLKIVSFEKQGGGETVSRFVLS